MRLLNRPFNERTHVPEKPKRIRYKDKYEDSKAATLRFFDAEMEPRRIDLPLEKKSEPLVNAPPEAEDNDIVVVAKEEAIEDSKPAPQTWFGTMSAWLPW